MAKTYIPTAMDNKTKDRLKAIPRTRCAECDSLQKYTNPMARCFECKKKFCFSHINAGMANSTMGKNTSLRDICDACIPKGKYQVAFAT